MMTDDENAGGPLSVREVRENGLGLDDLSSSPLGSFQSLQSNQSSENNKETLSASPLMMVRILQFEDTLSEMYHRSFNPIYEPLLLEGKGGNLTDLTIGMVLAGEPPTWLQVMHERLKHYKLKSHSKETED